MCFMYRDYAPFAQAFLRFIVDWRYDRSIYTEANTHQCTYPCGIHHKAIMRQNMHTLPP